MHKKGHHMMSEHHGSHREHLMAEHERHGMRMDHERAMHSMHGPLYKHEEDKPALPKEGHLMGGFGCSDFKAEADPIAYGQAGGELHKKDMGKIESQFKHYHWD